MGKIPSSPRSVLTFQIASEMDGNKEESLRCIEFAKNFMKLGDRAKAKRFLLKSERLYPTQQAKGAVVIKIDTDGFHEC